MSDAQTPVIRISLSKEISQGSQVIFETYLAQDDPPKVINGMLDKLGNAINRQIAKGELPHLEALLEKHETEYTESLEQQAQIQANVEARGRMQVAAGRRRSVEMTNKEKIDVENAGIKQERWKTEALKLRAAIADRRKLIEETE